MKAAEQILDLYERFAEEQAPMTLSELARALDMAPSTCFNLVRTFESRGFLYATGQRRALYPTKRMLTLTREIELHDPVGTAVVRCLSELRDATEETIILANRTRDFVTYLEVFESQHRIRYSARVGETRLVQLNSMGKALISLMPPDERDALAAELVFNKVTDRSLDNKYAFLADIERSIPRGWFLNDGESVIDVIAMAVPIVINGSAFAIGLAGPRHRVENRIPELAEQIKEARDKLLIGETVEP